MMVFNYPCSHGVLKSVTLQMKTHGDSERDRGQGLSSP